MVKAMDCGIVVSEFVLQSRYYVHFLANTLGRGTNPLICKGSRAIWKELRPGLELESPSKFPMAITVAPCVFREVQDRMCK